MQSRTELRCPRCGTPVEPLQQFCLRCGFRLPGGGSVGAVLVRTWRRLLPWYPGDWIWPVLALALLTVCSTAVALGARSERHAAAPTLIATSSHVTVSITTPATTRTTVAKTTTTAPTLPQPTISTGTLPLAPGAPSTTTPTVPAPTTTTRTPTGVRPWPSRKSGWTDVLESVPQSAGRSAAVSQARNAERAGVPSVGVLLSSRYRTLHAGYWVVFSGVYDSQTQAEGGLDAARSHGFPGAYPAQVEP